MLFYLYDVNVNNDIQPHPEIHNFTQRVTSLPPMLDVFIVLNEKTLRVQKAKVREGMGKRHSFFF